jgi:hypothetical protein
MDLFSFSFLILNLFSLQIIKLYKIILELCAICVCIYGYVDMLGLMFSLEL